MAFFEKAWYKRGRFKSFLDREGISQDDMRQNFHTFTGTKEYEAMLLAMDDFAEETEASWMELDVTDKAYALKMARLQERRKFKGWFKRLIHDFVELNESANVSGRKMHKYY